LAPTARTVTSGRLSSRVRRAQRRKWGSLMPVQRLSTASTYSRSALFGCLGAVVYGPGRRQIAIRSLAPGGNPLLVEFQRCFQLKFGFYLAFDFGPKFVDHGVERFVDLDLLADEFEGHDDGIVSGDAVSWRTC
jgi:hypothetical protein